MICLGVLHERATLLQSMLKHVHKSSPSVETGGYNFPPDKAAEEEEGEADDDWG